MCVTRPLLTPLLIAFALLSDPIAILADDWPQWRGPARNGVSGERGWFEHWPEAGPPIAWTAEVGRGHSCVVVGRGRAYTTGWDGENDHVYCFDAATGTLVWKQSYPCDDIVQWPGPRATPTVDFDTGGDSVYTLSQHGDLRAFDARDGRLRWNIELPASYEPDVDYGFAWSPLVEGPLLILGAGSKGLAVRKSDGSFAWGNDGQFGACASPVPYTWRGQRGVALVGMTPDREAAVLIGVEPKGGKELWRSDLWPEKWGAIGVDLLVHEGSVFITTSEQHLRCARFAIEGNKLVERWSHNKLASYTSGCVVLKGNLFGVTKAGILKCLDWETGEERWAQRGFDPHGTLMAAQGDTAGDSNEKLIVQAGKSGHVAVVEASAEKYHELRRVQVFEEQPETFTVPVLARGRLYCRSYAGKIVCYDLTGKAKAK